MPYLKFASEQVNKLTMQFYESTSLASTSYRFNRKNTQLLCRRFLIDAVFVVGG